MNNRGSVLKGLLALLLLGGLANALFAGVLYLKIRWLTMAFTGLGFAGAAFVAGLGLTASLAPGRTREGGTVLPGFVLPALAAGSIASAVGLSLWFWSAPRSVGALGTWVFAGALTAVFVGVAAALGRSKGPKNTGG